MLFDKEFLASAVRDRGLVILALLSVILGLAIIISTLLQVRPTDVQVPVRANPILSASLYNMYRDQWYYMLSFIGLGALLVVQPLLSLKLLRERGRFFAVAFATGTVIVGFIGLLLTLAILRVVSTIAL